MAPRLGRNETVLPPRRSLRIKEMKMKSTAKTTQTKFLPHEIILEILCWLLPKPLVRFKCVSKLWRESIEDHTFAHKHSTNLGLHHISKGNITIQENEENFQLLFDSHGLILERSNLAKFRVRNPLTKHALDIPDPMEDKLCPIMVYADTKKEYKLFCLYIKELEGTVMCGGFKFLTLETDNAWRNVVIPEFSAGVNIKHCLLNGCIFLVLTIDYQKIVCTEIESECFSIIDNIPKAFITATGSISLNSWDNKYSISRMDRSAAGDWKIDVWILEDYKKHIWAESKLSVNLSFINQKFPEDNTVVKFVIFMDKLLWVSVDRDKHFIGFNIVDADASPFIEDTDAYKRSFYAFCPNLAYLKGMKADDRDISDYEIIPNC